MPARSSRRWILALLMAVVFPALAIHVSCVAVIGPGTWGSGLEERVPQLEPASSNPKIGAYAREFETPAEPLEITTPAGIPGTVFGRDRLPDDGLAVIAVQEGPTWIEAQRFYLLQDGHATQLPFSDGMILRDPTLMRRGNGLFVVAERWQSWAVEPLRKLKRYLQSYLDSTIRAETSLYTYAVPGGPAQYWGPGHTLRPAPDRRKVALLRSGALGAGYYSLHVWDFEHDRLQTVLSLREADPGSGRSFDYRWSGDSRAIHIMGKTGGFERRKIEPRELDLIYLVEEDSIYDLGP